MPSPWPTSTTTTVRPVGRSASLPCGSPAASAMARQVANIGGTIAGRGKPCTGPHRIGPIDRTAMVWSRLDPMLDHRYGRDVLVFDDPYLSTLLLQIGSPQTSTAQLPPLVRTAYVRLLQEVLAREFPLREQRATTRMTAQEPRAFVQGPHLCRDTKRVICAVIRAGIL